MWWPWDRPGNRKQYKIAVTRNIWVTWMWNLCKPGMFVNIGKQLVAILKDVSYSSVQASDTCWIRHVHLIPFNNEIYCFRIVQRFIRKVLWDVLPTWCQREWDWAQLSNIREWDQDLSYCTKSIATNFGYNITMKSATCGIFYHALRSYLWLRPKEIKASKFSYIVNLVISFCSLWNESYNLNI
jgi:hypothetical protein